MLFRQLIDYDTCTYTYLIASTPDNEAIIIDPVAEKIQLYLQLIEELNLHLTYAIDTHLHADHITASGILKQKTECKIAMGKESNAEFIDTHLSDNDELKFGELTLRAIHTPGHTEDSYSFLLNDRVFTGDTLLIKATGRTDFQNGDAYKEYDSLFNKLLRLPKSTLVYPAHDYNGMTVSTIDDEIQFNPRLQVKSVDEYAEIMSQLNLPKPKNIDIAVPANMHCGIRLI